MKITYIHHSSFMAELDHAVLLFDYFEGKHSGNRQGEAFVCVCLATAMETIFPVPYLIWRKAAGM